MGAVLTPDVGSPILPTDPVVFDLTDATETLTSILITVRHDSGLIELAHDGTNFTSFFVSGSTRTVITDGYHYSLIRAGGWVDTKVVVSAFPFAGTGVGLINFSSDFGVLSDPPGEDVALSVTGATAGSFGNASHVATFAVDSKGRLTASAQTPIILTDNSSSSIAHVGSGGSTGTSVANINDVNSAVGAEATLRAAGDATSAGALATETAARIAGDSAETAARIAADALLSPSSGIVRTPKPNEFWVYTLDYDGTGNDTTGAPGIATTMSAALAAAVPLKTFERLTQVRPPTGNGATLVVLAKPRAAFAPYRNIANTADADGSWLTGLGDWVFVGRGSLDFANDANDKIRAGFLTLGGTNAGGYNAIAGSTVKSLVCQLAGGGAPGFTAESGGQSPLTGYRIRFLATTPTTALQNVCTGIHENTATTIIPMVDLPAVPSASDVFVIEGPGVTVGSLSFTAGWNRSFSLVGFNCTGAAAIVAPAPVQRIAGCAIGGAFSESFNEQFAAASVYSDEANATITVGFGLRLASSGTFNSSKTAALSSSSWLGTTRLTFQSSAPFGRAYGSACVGVNGINDFFTGGPDATLIGNQDLAGSSTFRKLRVTNPTGPALELGGVGANVFGVDVSNCTNGGSTGGCIWLSGAPNTTVKTFPGSFYFDDIISGHGGNTGGSPSLTNAVLFINDQKFRDGLKVYWGARKACTITADRDILMDGSASGRFADLAIQNLSIAGVRIYGPDPAAGDYFNIMLAGPTALVEVHDAGAFGGGPFPPFRVYHFIAYADGAGTAPLALPAQADASANCSGIAGVSTNYVYIAGDLPCLAQGGPVTIEFETGSFPAGTFPAGSIAYLSTQGGANTGKARIGPPSSGVAVPLGPIQAIKVASGDFAIVNLLLSEGVVRTEGHAAETALVSIAGTVSDLALTASTVLGRGPAGDVAAIPFTTIAAAAAFTVANNHDLAALDASLLGDGARRFVATYKAWFRLDKVTVRTASSDVVVAATGGVGWWWVREPATEPFWQAVTSWQISPASGNNENDGTTSPVKTHAEITRRRAGLTINATPCVITYLDDAAEVPIVDGMTLATSNTNENLVYTAAPIQVWPASGFGTIAGGALTTANFATNISNTLVDSTLPTSWTVSGLVGKMIHFYDSGTLAIVGTAHIVEDLGSKRCRLDFVTDLTDVWNVGGGGPGTVAVGNLFKVFTHVSIPEPVAHSAAGLVIRCHGLSIASRGDGTSIRGSTGKGVTLLYNLCEFPNTGTWLNQHIIMVGCYFANVRFNWIQCSGSVTFCSGAAQLQFVGGPYNIFQGYMGIGPAACLLFVDCAVSLGFNYGWFSSAVSGIQLRNARVSFTGAYFGSNNSGLLIDCLQNNSSIGINNPAAVTAVTSANPTIALAVTSVLTRVTGTVADIPLWDDFTNSSIVIGS